MLKELYEEVQGIVYKCRNEYYLHLWELSDWEQEGMICLHELISIEEELVEDIPRLRKYFKTKFRNRILDYLRKQESQKRRYDKEPYEEVGEISHRIGEGGLWLDDYYSGLKQDVNKSIRKVKLISRNILTAITVSYTHLTLPTILLV